MLCTSLPSLEHSALVRTAVTLWSEDDVKNLLSRFDWKSPVDNCNDRKIEKEWKKLQVEMTVKIMKLPLPILLKNKLEKFVLIVGKQILFWKVYHNRIVGMEGTRDSLCKLSWTSQGIIDRKKTAEVFVRDETLDIYVRYKFACTYCLEAYIGILWEQLKDSYKGNLRRIRKHESDLVSFWSHYMTGKIDKRVSYVHSKNKVTRCIYSILCRSARNGNETAFKYFFQKLSPGEKEEILEAIFECVMLAEPFVFRKHRLAFHHFHLMNFSQSFSFTKHGDSSKIYYTQILYLVFLQMNSQQQVEVFTKYPYEILTCFLLWPWQDLFITASQRIGTFLSEMDFHKLLLDLVHLKDVKGCSDFDYGEHFGIFWKHSPISHKKYVINGGISHHSLLLSMFEAEDVENIKLIFKDATTEEKAKLILCRNGQDVCLNLVYTDKWELVEFFIRECILTKNEMKIFEQECKQRLASHYLEENVSKKKWHKFFQLLNNLIAECK